MPGPLRGGSLKRHTSIAILGLALLALVVHTLFGEKGYLALRKQREEIERLQAEIDRLSGENKRLLEEIQALKTDPEAVERVAREQLKMARPGEKVIMLPDKRTSDQQEQRDNRP